MKKKRFKIGDAVRVQDEGLSMLRKFVPSMPVNNEGIVGDIYDDGTIVVHFKLRGNDHWQAAPYAPDKVSKV